jgi:hypothetical protein
MGDITPISGAVVTVVNRARIVYTEILGPKNFNHLSSGRVVNVHVNAKSCPDDILSRQGVHVLGPKIPDMDSLPRQDQRRCRDMDNIQQIRARAPRKGWIGGWGTQHHSMRVI